MRVVALFLVIALSGCLAESEERGEGWPETALLAAGDETLEVTFMEPQLFMRADRQEVPGVLVRTSVESFSGDVFAALGPDAKPEATWVKSGMASFTIHQPPLDVRGASPSHLLWAAEAPDGHVAATVHGNYTVEQGSTTVLRGPHVVEIGWLADYAFPAWVNVDGEQYWETVEARGEAPDLPAAVPWDVFERSPAQPFPADGAMEFSFSDALEVAGEDDARVAAMLENDRLMLAEAHFSSGPQPITGQEYRLWSINISTPDESIAFGVMSTGPDTPTNQFNQVTVNDPSPTEFFADRHGAPMVSFEHMLDTCEFIHYVDDGEPRFGCSGDSPISWPATYDASTGYLLRQTDL